MNKIIGDHISNKITKTTILLGTSIGGQYVSQQLLKEESLFFYKKYTFGEEYTNIIDDMLMKDNRGQVSNVLIELGQSVPGIGDHYFYYTPDMNFVMRWLYYIKFTK